MDPNATLRELREIPNQEPDWAEHYADRMVELIGALDEWLSNGGFPPDAWTQPAKAEPTEPSANVIQYRAANDGVQVVEIETGNLSEDASGPHIRVYLNEEPIFANPDFTAEDDAETEEFINAAIEAMLWAETAQDAPAEPEDHDRSFRDLGYDHECLTDELREKLAYHCRRFLAHGGRALIEGEPEPPTSREGHDRWAMAGHDFWLTARGHGAGFWDGDWKQNGDALTELAKCPEIEHNILPYVTEDGKVDG